MDKITGDYVSVCVLSLERYQYIRGSLESLIRATEYPYELVVHDDGSWDPRVHHYLHTLLCEGKISTLIFGGPPGYNTGPGLAYERMGNIAHGKYIAMLDGDMYYKKGWLAQAVSILEVFPEVEIVGLCRGGSTQDQKVHIRTETRDGITIELKWIPGGGCVVRRESYEKGAFSSPFSPGGYDPIRFLQAFYPVMHYLKKMKQGKFPPLEVLNDGWGVMTQPENDKVFHSHGEVYWGSLSVWDDEGTTYRRPSHFHPKLHGNFEKYPVVPARLKGEPFDRPLQGARETPLERLGTGEGRDFLISLEASTGKGRAPKRIIESLPKGLQGG